MQAAHRAFHQQELDPFLFELADRWRMPVGELQERMPPGELAQWKGYKAYCIQQRQHTRKRQADLSHDW